MELTGERRVAADRARTWSALNDPAVLQACVPGCESFQRTGDDAYTVVVAVALGPVRARFRGKLRVENVSANSSYTLRFEGEGAAAGFAKGSADVTLADADGGTLVAYRVNAQVGGRIAQVGSRLVDAAALKLADDFFAAFDAAVSGTLPVSGTMPVSGTKPASGTLARYVIIAAVVAAVVAALVYSLRS